MNTERAQIGWGLWLRWMLATAVVPAVVLTAVWVPYGVSDDEGRFFAAFFLTLPLTLASIVIGQWLVLRREVSRAGRWALASIVVYVVAGAVEGPYGTSLWGSAAVVGAALVGFFVYGAIYGAITGGVLVRLLRQRKRPLAA